MTADKYRAALVQLGMNPTAAASLLGVSAPTSRRYMQQGIHGAPEILLKLLLTGRITRNDIAHAIFHRT